eukprot:PhF_6_TR39992/c0_g1_i1/m.59354
MFRRSLSRSFREAAKDQAKRFVKGTTEYDPAPRSARKVVNLKTSLDPWIDKIGDFPNEAFIYRIHRQLIQTNKELHYSFFLFNCAFTFATTFPILWTQMNEYLCFSDVIKSSGFIDPATVDQYTPQYRVVTLPFQMAIYFLWVEGTTYVRYPLYLYFFAPMWRQLGLVAVKRPEWLTGLTRALAPFTR